jgi:hypothetical protein
LETGAEHAPNRQLPLHAAMAITSPLATSESLSLDAARLVSL